MPTQPKSNCDRLREGDKTVIESPWPVTVNEIHAGKYGTVGAFVGAWAHYRPQAAIGLSITLYLVAFGLRKISEKRCERSFALLTIRHEPHWFTVVYFISYIVAYQTVIIG